jgi:hypothetical protein
MKKLFLFAAAILTLTSIKAQELNVGMDFYNRYVFRGVDFGSSPSLQPSIEFSAGNFSLGAWGAYSTGNGSMGEFGEADLYASYAFDFGLSVGLTSYYYPGSSWFELEDEVSSHAIELNMGYEISGFSLSGNYMLNNSVDGAGAEDGIMYFEAGYGTDLFNVFIGGGDGWHSDDGDFEVVNIGVGTSKEIKVSDTFSIPVNGAVILNPNTEQLHLVVGISF